MSPSLAREHEKHSGVCKIASSADAADGSVDTRVWQRSASALLRVMDVNGEAHTGHSAGGYASNKLAQVLQATCPQTSEQGASSEADPQKFSLHAGHFKENGDDMGKLRQQVDNGNISSEGALWCRFAGRR